MIHPPDYHIVRDAVVVLTALGERDANDRATEQRAGAAPHDDY
jgi:hypothetical protein